MVPGPAIVAFFPAQRCEGAFSYWWLVPYSLLSTSAVFLFQELWDDYEVPSAFSSSLHERDYGHKEQGLSVSHLLLYVRQRYTGLG